MKLACVVVLYHPSEEVENNIRTYLPQVDCILKWDNTPHNVGIGAALNEGIRMARAQGCTHLMTMDQDSSFLPGEMTRYRAKVEQWEEEHQGQTAVFSTNYYLRSQHTTLYPEETSIVQVTSAMTSASIYPLELFERLGLFREDLFVWGIDCEFCWRAARQGIPTLCFRDILLQHEFGYQKKKHRLLGREVFPNEYPPARTYYNVRNGIVLYRTYPDYLNLKAHLHYHLWKRIVFVLLYEQQKLAKLKALWKGYWDGRRGKTGKLV